MSERAPARTGAWSWRRLFLFVSLGGAALVAAGNVYILATTHAAIVTAIALAPVRPVVIVLGAFVLPIGQPSSELAERLDTARALYQAGRARRIIVSGMVKEGYDEPHPMAAWLEAHGIPATDVIVDVRGHRTAATMADAAALGVRSALVSTQAYHLPRALYLARYAGIDAIGVVALRGHPMRSSGIFVVVREILARAEIVIEVALRGVRG